MRVAVVGAGAVGVTAARELAERDAEVTLFEAGEVAAGSSGRAAGICYDAFADRVDPELADQSLARFRDLPGPPRVRVHRLPVRVAGTGG